LGIRNCSKQSLHVFIGEIYILLLSNLSKNVLFARQINILLSEKLVFYNRLKTPQGHFNMLQWIL
jgi:hypothetical protein